MGEVPQRDEDEPQPAARERVNDAVRELLTGDGDGRLRRPILFIMTGIGLVVPELAPLSLASLIALALTDQVVTL